MTFYIDKIRGDDGNDGRTPQTPWESLERVHVRTYEPGDSIYFRRGGKWEGMFCPAGSGTAERPITVDAYGDEEDLPLIDGMGAAAAVCLFRVDHWTVRNLKCVNTASGRAVRSGIMIEGRPRGITGNITVSQCEITAVHGENRREMPFYRSMYWNGGIYVTFPYKCTEEDHLENILIEGNHIHDVLTSGIRVNQQEDSQKDIWHTGVVVRGNRVERTGADAIIVANCISPIIEYNRCYDAGALGTLEDTFLIAGVWVCATRDALIQYNEVARTRLFDNDGTAFDTDWGVAGTTVFQYNYTHGNEGGFWLDCTTYNRNPDCKGNLIRGNVSVNDRRCLTQYSSGSETVFSENRFIQTETPVEICNQGDGASHRYRQNAFALHRPPATGWQHAVYDGNCYVSGNSNPDDPAVQSIERDWISLAKEPETLDGQEERFGLCFSKEKESE